MADREIIGRDWLRFLRQRWFKNVQQGTLQCLVEKAYVYGEVIQVVATRSPTGDLVIIATDFGTWETWDLYRQRWSVECTFFSVKTRGFDLERTGVTQPARLERLFGLVILAWVACLRIGVWLETSRPIVVKVHGRKRVSLIRHGAEHLTNALGWQRDKLSKLLSLITTPFLEPGAD
jgi:Transposase DDE domain